MTLYLDASALLKRYLDEPDSSECEAILRSDTTWLTGRHTSIEVRRNLVRDLAGEELTKARRHFTHDWLKMSIVDLDAVTCDSAASLAETTGVRTLDALHLAAAQRTGVSMVTYDLRLAEAARSLGMRVLGA